MIRSKLLLLTALLAFTAGCGQGRPGPGDSDQDGSEDTPKDRVILVRTVHPSLGSVTDALPITARVEAFEQAEVIPRIEGIVTEIHKVEGDRVVAGDLLAVIDCAEQILEREGAALAIDQARQAAEQAVLALAEAEARLESNLITVEREEKNRARARGQHAKGAIADQDLEAAEHAADTAKAERKQLEVARDKLAKDRESKTHLIKDAQNRFEQVDLRCSWAQLRATIPGTITSRELHLGQKAAPGVAAYRIADFNSLVIRPTLPEAELRNLRTDLMVKIYTKTWPDRVFAGRLEHIAPEVDPTFGSVQVRIRLETSEPSLLPGMFVTGRIITDERPNVLLIPKKAIQDDRDRPLVYTVVGEGEQFKVRKVWIRRGLESGEMVECLPSEGGGEMLTADDRIVVVGLDRLFDGAKVRLAPESPTKEPTPVDPDAKTTKNGETSEAERDG